MTEVTPERFLTGAEILAAVDRTFAVVNVPEWGGKVRVQSLTAEEAAQLNDPGGDPKDGVQRIVALCVVDAEGKAQYTVADIEKLKKKSLRALLRVQEVAMEINGLGEAAKELLAKV